MDLAQNSNCSVTAIDKLDALEIEIFSEAYDAKNKLNEWLVESGVKLEAASLVVNRKKRKRELEMWNSVNGSSLSIDLLLRIVDVYIYIFFKYINKYFSYFFANSLLLVSSIQIWIIFKVLNNN